MFAPRALSLASKQCPAFSTLRRGVSKEAAGFLCFTALLRQPCLYETAYLVILGVQDLRLAESSCDQQLFHDTQKGELKEATFVKQSP